MDNSIGKRIKSRRNELNLTQIQIQEATGISSGNMSGIEAGKSLPSANALMELSKILNCSIDWILTGNSSISETPFYSDVELNLLTDFRKLSIDDKEELLGILALKLKKLEKSKEKNADESFPLAATGSDNI